MLNAKQVLPYAVAIQGEISFFSQMWHSLLKEAATMKVILYVQTNVLYVCMYVLYIKSSMHVRIAVE